MWLFGTRTDEISWQLWHGPSLNLRLYLLPILLTVSLKLSILKYIGGGWGCHSNNSEYSGLLIDIFLDLDRWGSLKLTIWSKVNMLKINVLRKYCVFFLASPPIFFKVIFIKVMLPLVKLYREQYILAFHSRRSCCHFQKTALIL